jgi:pectinesterase
MAQTNIKPITVEVALDGTGKFTSVQDAIMSVPIGTATNPVVIHLKPGTYHELIYIQREKRFFRLVGDDAEKTIITFGLYANMTNLDGKPIGTFHTPTALIDSDDFIAENITFDNSAGPVGQALAIRTDGDRDMFRHCRFLGWQDTILINRGRDYFDDCYIEGATDFIFGGATAWFEKCHIHCAGDGFIAAASTPYDAPFGYVFSHCKITGEPETQTFLGRPWRVYASTIYLNTTMAGIVRPEGWNAWGKADPNKTRYAEFNSTGGGANPEARAKWALQLTAAEAAEITPQKVLDGWDPALEAK